MTCTHDPAGFTADRCWQCSPATPRAAQEEPTSPRTQSRDGVRMLLTLFDKLARGVLDTHGPVAVTCRCAAHEEARAWINSEEAAEVADFVNGREAAAATPSLDPERLGNALYDAQNQPWSQGSPQERYYRNEMVELARMTLARLEDSATPEQKR